MCEVIGGHFRQTVRSPRGCEAGDGPGRARFPHATLSNVRLTEQFCWIYSDLLFTHFRLFFLVFACFYNFCFSFFGGEGGAGGGYSNYLQTS